MIEVNHICKEFVSAKKYPGLKGALKGLVSKDNIRNAIKEINERYQTTVVLTTHDIEDIEELCSRILIIDNGKLIYEAV